jgi:hypothetical protein
LALQGKGGSRFGRIGGQGPPMKAANIRSIYLLQFDPKAWTDPDC